MLFYHCKLKPLIAIELKIGKGCLQISDGIIPEVVREKWNAIRRRNTNRFNTCTEGNKEEIELLQLNKSGIKIAEYMTELPSKRLLQQKLHQGIESSKKYMENSIEDQN